MRIKLTGVALVLTFLLVLTGCSQNQQVIFNAAMNMQNVKSMQQHTSMTFQLSGSGFEPDVQQQVNMAKMYLNMAKLDLDIKTSGNIQKTVVKSHINMNLALPEMDINMPIWVDSDLTGDTPKVSEIIKLPQIAKVAMPPQYASKDYIVLNALDMNQLDMHDSDSDSDFGNINMMKLVDFSKNFYAEEIAFLNSYSQRFNPKVNVVSIGKQYIQTNDGPKSAQIYQVKLNDAQFKDLIRYTVNNFSQDTEAINFVKASMLSILEFGEVPNAETLIDFEQAFKEFEANKPEFLAEFNTFMDELEAVSILGDKGLEIKYAISEGFCIQKTGTLNLKIDVAQINQFQNSLDLEESTDIDAKGILDLQINFKTDISGINSPLEINIPEVNSVNSINYMDLMKSFASGSGGQRLAGRNQYQTARIIGENYNSGTCENIIIATGDNFPDALSSSILSKKFDAPVLLVGTTVELSSEAFRYIALHSNPDTKLFIIGGTGVIDSSIETELIKRGHVNIERLNGYDRYDTNMVIVDKANVEIGTPVFVASGENFSDALSVSSFSGLKQYPTLLVGQNNLSDRTTKYITANKPSIVYIVGGVFAVSETVEAQIKELVPTAIIKRLAGKDRFDTAGKVINEFSENPQTVYLANGYNFTDALAGSVFAAKTGDPVLLIDNSETLPPAVEAYLKKLRDEGNRPMVRAFGGTVVVPDILIKQAQNVLDGK